jgi:hypothetical protein
MRDGLIIWACVICPAALVGILIELGQISSALLRREREAGKGKP